MSSPSDAARRARGRKAEQGVGVLATPVPHATTSSSSSECSSYGGFSSSEAESSQHCRLRPIRTSERAGELYAEGVEVGQAGQRLRRHLRERELREHLAPDHGGVQRPAVSQLEEHRDVARRGLRQYGVAPDDERRGGAAEDVHLGGAPSSQPIFPDEILGEIFLRLGSAADLARTSAACTAFLRVVRFLRRNRSLYRRPVVGFLEYESHFLPQHHPRRTLRHAEPPHRSSSPGRALAQLVDLTFSFVPDPTSWRICDSGDGRVLLAPRTFDTIADFVDLVVCDPLHRRYVRIPPIPDDLTTGISRCGRVPFLAPAGEEESSFGVIWIVRLNGKVSAFVFSSATGKWRGGVTSDGWIGYWALMLTPCRYHAGRSLYRISGLFIDVLMLDTRRMEFSVVRIPNVGSSQQLAIVEAENGRLGLLMIGAGMINLYCKAWQDNDAGPEEWQHEKTITLPKADSLWYTFSGAGEGYLLLQAIPQDPSVLASSSQGVRNVQYFTLEVKTLLLEKLCVSDKRIHHAHLYANFPLLSLPTV